MSVRIVCLMTVVGFLAFLTPVKADEPLIVAHRGLLEHAPENTLSNFRACLELRLGFEFDVAVTEDGHLVCIHDDTVDRTTNGTGAVAEMALEEIRNLDAGSWYDAGFAGEKVPTIDEVFSLVAEYRRHSVLIAADIKVADAADDVARLAERHGIQHRILYIGRTISDPQVRDMIKRVSPQAHTAAVANNADEFSGALTASAADWVYFRYLPAQHEMDAVHEAGKHAFIAGDTVAGNHPGNWQRAAEVEMDGILTNYPMELRRTVRRMRSR